MADLFLRAWAAADPRESAVGRISMEMGKVVITDDSELWGISVLN